MKYLLLLTLISFSTIAAEITKEEYVMVGICLTMLAQEEHNSDDNKLKGAKFLNSFWKDIAKVSELTPHQLFTTCIQLVDDHPERPHNKAKTI